MALAAIHAGQTQCIYSSASVDWVCGFLRADVPPSGLKSVSNATRQPTRRSARREPANSRCSGSTAQVLVSSDRYCMGWGIYGVYYARRAARDDQEGATDRASGKCAGVLCHYSTEVVHSDYNRVLLLRGAAYSIGRGQRRAAREVAAAPARHCVL